MATLSITIPTDQVNRVQDAICAVYGYNPDTDGTKTAFTKGVVINFIKNTVKSYEVDQASVAAREAALADAEAGITLT